MKKNFLLSFCVLCVCGVSACNSLKNDSKSIDVYISENEAPIIDTTVDPYGRCGVNGISCNDTALVNYTETETDYRAYGERTKRDHLYTQSAVGNNLAATVQPGLEEDVVVSNIVVSNTVSPTSTRKYVIDNGVFSQTGALELEPRVHKYPLNSNSGSKSQIKNNSQTDGDVFDPQVQKYSLAVTENSNSGNESQIKNNSQTSGGAFDPHAQKYSLSMTENSDSGNESQIRNNSQGQVIVHKIADAKENEAMYANNVETMTTIGKNRLGRKLNVKEVLKSEGSGSTYEIVCEEECDDIINDDIITSEFTEESFDIADYIEESGDADVRFIDVGKEKQTIDVAIDEVLVGDNTILTWEAQEGENLRELLTKWSAMSGWKLLWNTNRNYILNAGVMFKGKFADVSAALIRAFARARPAPVATYYKGNRVIVVETMENENAY